LQEFWSLSDEAESRHAYTVAWVDCLSRAGRIGQGLCFSGDHAPVCARARAAPPRARRFPIDPPFSLVNRLSLTAFNFVYWRRPLARPGAIAHMESFFYPLDRIDRWNRIYGRQGFYQYQCVVPEHDAIEALLQQISASGQGSFLAVLKAFGSLPSPGLLSFARPGFTLALDFPNRGPATTRLFERLDSVVVEAGGALYPAKDSRMPAAVFRKGFPAWERFLRFRDPAFSSSFARRVGLEEPCRAP